MAAHVEIRVLTEHHVTLVHFGEMDLEKFEVVHEILTDIMKMVKRPPTGVFGDHRMFGQFKNVHGQIVQSDYVKMLRGELVSRLDARGVTYSNNFGNPGNGVLHVSRPLPEWRHGSAVPFADFITFVWKHQATRIDYELGGKQATEGTFADGSHP